MSDSIRDVFKKIIQSCQTKLDGFEALKNAGITVVNDKNENLDDFITRERDAIKGLQKSIDKLD